MGKKKRVRQGTRWQYMPRPREHKRKPDPHPDAIDLDALVEPPEKPNRKYPNVRRA